MREKLPYLLLVLSLFSCVWETGSGDFVPPEIVRAEAMAEVREAHLVCELSDYRVERCGFAWGTPGGELKRADCKLQGVSFEMDLTGLEPGTTYEWYAFARAGEEEIRSEVARFTTDPLPPLPPEERAEIADPVFKTYLTEHFDTDGDSEISLSEALAVRTIAVCTKEIASLQGIEYFRNLDTLICAGVEPDFDVYAYDGHPGLLQSLDISVHSRLRYLRCDGNMIRTLVLPASSRLEVLICSRNMLSELDLALLPSLRFFQAWMNDFSSLDFTQCPWMESIEIGDNRITELDVTNCPRLFCLNLANLPIKTLDLSGNPNLDWLGVYGTSLTSLDLSANHKLRWLDCFETDIASLDLTPCDNLYELKCWRCRFSELDISMLPLLEIVDCAPMASLNKLYVSEDQKIEGITQNRSEENVPAATKIVVRYKDAPGGKIQFEDPAFKGWLLSLFDSDRDGDLSLEEAEEVRKIDVTSNEWNITSLQGIEFMPNLEYLRCAGDWIGTTVLNRPFYYLSKHYHWDECIGPIGTLKRVDVSRNPKLRVLDLSNNSGIGETGSGTIDLSNNPLLEEICLPMCFLIYPDVSACFQLRILNISHGRGLIPDLSHNPDLREIHLDFNQTDIRRPIDVSGCPNLEKLDVGASVSGVSDLHKNPQLKSLRIGWCGMSDLDVSMCSNLEELDCQSNDLNRIDLSSLKHLRELTVSGNPLGTLDVSNLSSLERLLCHDCQLRELDLRKMPNLTYLECQSNSLSSLDLSGNPRLREVYCAGNPLYSLDLTKNPMLRTLYCAYTGLKSLDVSWNPELVDLRCDHNQLDRLDLSANPGLVYLYFEYCRIAEIDLSNNPELGELDCSGNGLRELDLSHNPRLRWLVCKENLPSSLDVSHNPCLQRPNGDEITGLICAPMNGPDGENLLQTLRVAPGQSIQGVTTGRSTDHIPDKTVIHEK